jgi:hypothetical protein
VIKLGDDFIEPGTFLSHAPLGTTIRMAETLIRIVDHEGKLIAIEEEETPLMTSSQSHAISKNKRFGSSILAPFRFSIAHPEICMSMHKSPSQLFPG